MGTRLGETHDRRTLDACRLWHPGETWLIRVAIGAAVIAFITACVASAAPRRITTTAQSPPYRRSRRSPRRAQHPHPHRHHPRRRTRSRAWSSRCRPTRFSSELEPVRQRGLLTVDTRSSSDPGSADRRHRGQLHQCACRSAERSSPAAITAQSVRITPATDGKCPPPAGFYGTVTSVSGNTIAVNGLGPGGQTTPTNVTVADSKTYNKQTASSSQAIGNGKCLGAQGTNSGAALQATTIALQACPAMGRPHHHHLPHLPFHI